MNPLLPTIRTRLAPRCIRPPPTTIWKQQIRLKNIARYGPEARPESTGIDGKSLGKEETVIRTTRPREKEASPAQAANSDTKQRRNHRELHSYNARTSMASKDRTNHSDSTNHNHFQICELGFSADDGFAPEDGHCQFFNNGMCRNCGYNTDYLPSSTLRRSGRE
ncbi:hypothetical protein BJ508DRAFT_75359 [Ascobolus immersus RN42]|uniref:Uncharacterized protein n=1 Tax=Ascobolus immersus RN42 TaxID=1160509 RepID=A0A3N4INU0_ASCIM|nr:hypothetical protein BJ508DRAFT_75359 [Ascobolus immersus RN42]